MGRKRMENNKKKSLPEELIVEILLKLPVKSLVRFKCVSKSWLSLISDPHFAKSHFELAAAPTHRLIYITTSGSEARSLDLEASLHDDSAAVKLNFSLTTSSNIRGCCRGIILLGVYPNLILWNPSTGDQKTISYSDVSRFYRSARNFTFLYGFGYDPSTDDYLVVIASWDSKAANFATQLEFFSLRTDLWSKIGGTHFPYMNARYESTSGSVFNGALHWLAYRRDSRVYVIIAFDLIERNLSEIPVPDYYVKEYNFCLLRVLGGCLSLCFRLRSDITEIWVMKEYKVQSSWTKSILVSPYEFPTSYFSPICFTKGGEIVGLDGIAGLVKLNDKGELLEHRAYCDDGHSCEAAMYTESLLPLPCSFWE